MTLDRSATFLKNITMKTTSTTVERLNLLENILTLTHMNLKRSKRKQNKPLRTTSDIQPKAEKRLRRRLVDERREIVN